MGDDLKAEDISVEAFVLAIKDLRCWVKHFYDLSTIPELTKIKAMQRCCSMLVKVVTMTWDEYQNADHGRRLEYLHLIKTSLQLLDWLCVDGKEHFIFSQETGQANIQLLLARLNRALSQFRAPPDHV
jgi:hypothetical protein